MRELIATTDIKREKGFIYFIGTAEDGTLEIYKSKAGRPKKKDEPKRTEE